MRKIILLIIILSLSACSINKDNKEKTANLNQTFPTIESCNKTYKISSSTDENLTLKAIAVSDKVKNITASKWWIVKYLNCNPWQKVNPNTLIATISPNWQDPNVKNLLNQKKSIQQQINNTQQIINFTKNNFASQLNSLLIQKHNLENQITILKNNLKNLEKQKKYGLWDLETQIKTLEKQLNDLEETKKKLEKSKQADLEKINQNIANTIKSIETFLSSLFLKIDEIFGITDKNRYKNDAYETYLSAQNHSLKEKIKSKFVKIINKWEIKDRPWYLQEVIDLVKLVKQAISDSIETSRLPKSQIDAWYNLFSQHQTTLINFKSNLDNLNKSLEITENNYDNQIINIQTQINTIKNNLANLKQNKISSYTSSIDIQINQTKSQITANKSSLENVLSQIENLKSQEQIQLKQLENQLNSLQLSLNNILTNLQEEKIYAKTSWQVKSKLTEKWNLIMPNNPICQIVPSYSSLKLQVFSNEKLQLNQKVYFNNCFTQISSVLPYKDKVSQNNIYETESFAICDNKKTQLSQILKEWQVLTVSTKLNKNWKIFIPLDFVINKITWQFVKKQTSTGFVITEVKLWDIDGSFVEVLSWVNLQDTICK